MRVPKDKFHREVANYIGTEDAEMVMAFAEVAKGVHQSIESGIVQHNIAIKDTMEGLGSKGIDYVRIVAELRSGKVDASDIKRFDEFVEYAVAHHAHALANVSGESSAGTDEDRFVAMLVKGIQEVPESHDQSVFDQAAAIVGDGFMQEAAERQKQRVSDRVIPNSAKRQSQIESFFEQISQDIKDIELETPNRVSPIWRLNKLKKIIERLPQDERHSAMQASRYWDLVEMTQKAKPRCDRNWDIPLSSSAEPVPF